MSGYIEIADQMLAAHALGDRPQRERLSAIMRAAFLAEADLTSRACRVKVLRRHAKAWPFRRATMESPLELERQFFDHGEAFKTAEGPVIVCHLYDCDRIKCEEFAEAIGAEVEFPPARSWWHHSCTLMVWRLPPAAALDRSKRMRVWLRTQAMLSLMGIFAPRVWVQSGRFESYDLTLATLADLQDRFLRWELAQLKRERERAASQ